MSIEHKDIPDSQRHEPKGAGSALEGQVYRSDGAGSGLWGNVLQDASEIGIERLLDGLSVAASQEPSGTDTPLQIEFGPSQLTASDPVSITSAGVLTINEAGTYRIKVSTAVGRTGGAGTSDIYIRAVVNGAGAGQSIRFKLTSSDVYIPFSDEAWLTLPAGTEIKYEILRDSSGNNSGGLFAGNPTLAGWADNPSAAIRVERWTS